MAEHASFRVRTIGKDCMLLIDNIGVLATMNTNADGPTGIIDDAAILIDGEVISWFGRRSQMPKVAIDSRIDAHSNLVIPGLIDCHSHLVFAGQRADEFARRMNNESYQDIMKRGGGIMSTVNATRHASDETLLELSTERANKILSSGVTTLEAKSGYGLSLDEELRALRILNVLNRKHPLDIHATILCHIVPPSFSHNRDAYVSMLEHELLPRVVDENLAIDCDVFCETGAFTTDESMRILSRAQNLSLGLRAHILQLGVGDSMLLVSSLPIKSVSHVDFVCERDVEILANSQTIVEALPFAALFLRSKRVTPVEILRKAGISLAIATDFNPGSAMCDDLVQAARLGVTYLNFSIDDALLAITKNAARALGRDDIGTIAVGNLSDLVITNCKSVNEFFYDWTKHPTRIVIKRGQIIS